MPENMGQDRCGEFATRLESVVEAQAGAASGMLEPELAAHLKSCESCQAAYEDAELARTLLRWGMSPAEPRYGFVTRVMAEIRAEQLRRESSGSIFWRPVELLAGRFAMAAAVIVLVMSMLVYESEQPASRPATTTEITELVQQPDTSQPQSPDDVLVSLAERSNAR